MLPAQVVPVHGSPFINKAATPRVGLDTNGDFAISVWIYLLTHCYLYCDKIWENVTCCFIKLDLCILFIGCSTGIWKACWGQLEIILYS